MIRHSWFCIVLLLAAIPIGAQEPDTRIGIRFHAAYGPEHRGARSGRQGVAGKFRRGFLFAAALGNPVLGSHAFIESDFHYVSRTSPARQPKNDYFLIPLSVGIRF